jgi:hypothetical protein
MANDQSVTVIQLQSFAMSNIHADLNCTAHIHTDELGLAAILNVRFLIAKP